MADKSKKTGLGASAFFEQPLRRPSTPAEAEEEAPPAQEERPRSEKIRTTVTFYPDTLAMLDMLKMEARRAGERATYSEILAEAIHTLAAQKGVSLPPEP